MEDNSLQMRAYIEAKFMQQGDFNIFPKATFEAAIFCAMETEEKYMMDNGIYDGKEYDDEAAFDAVYAALCAKLPDEKMYLMRFADDYLDYSEAYLESIGAIDWE